VMVPDQIVDGPFFPWNGGAGWTSTAN
jgi:hypothetical protein